MREGGEGFGNISPHEVRKIQKKAAERVDNERATRGDITDAQMREKQFRIDARDSAGGMNSADLRRTQRGHR